MTDRSIVNPDIGDLPFKQSVKSIGSTSVRDVRSFVRPRTISNKRDRYLCNDPS